MGSFTSMAAQGPPLCWGVNLGECGLGDTQEECATFLGLHYCTPTPLTRRPDTIPVPTSQMVGLDQEEFGLFIKLR